MNTHLVDITTLIVGVMAGVIFLCAGSGMAGPTRIYKDRTGEDVVRFCWSLQKTDANLIQITAYKPRETFINTCRQDGSTVRWQVTKPQLQAKAWVANGTLFLQGRINDQPVSWHKPIHGQTWCQPLSFSLRDIARGERLEKTFFFLRPDTLKPMDFKASRIGEETITLDGCEVKTVHVRIRMDGFFSTLWHGDYWFRTKDWLFVRYQGRNGPPGTPETVIELAQERLQWQSCLHELDQEENSDHALAKTSTNTLPCPSCQ